MEYFVDEMPRDCASCKHYHMNCADGYSCSKLRKEIHLNFSEGMGYRHKDCPLQSLADYTKQVRKEVCDEIKKKAELFAVCKTGILKEEYRIDKELLDQIQGEADDK